MTRVSVLMPARNAEHTIELAVKSTLFALGPQSELLVYEDGSVDSTRRKLNKIASEDARLKIFPSEHSVGVAVALNKLIKESKNEIVARMDSDDISLPWRFRSLDRKLKNVDFYFNTAFVLTRKFPGISVQVPINLSNPELIQVLLERNPLAHPTMIAKKTALNSLGGYKNLAAEDWDLWIRAMCAGFIIFRSWCPAVAMRVHAGQVTQSPAWKLRLSAEAYGKSNPAFEKFAEEQVHSLDLRQKLKIGLLLCKTRLSQRRIS